MGRKGLSYQRAFTQEGVPPIEMFDHSSSNIDITDDAGNITFTQKDSRFPVGYSELARKMVSSKYFYGERGTSERENSAGDLIGRVTEKIGDWARQFRYFNSDKAAQRFQDDLAYLTLDQRMAFNSPVWFNVGTDKIAGNGSNVQKTGFVIEGNGVAVPIPVGMDRFYPQTSACFIQSVEDTMEDIMDLAVREAMLFKYGSGTGSNLSTLRSSKEKLSGGGKPSGPLAYWAFYDKVAGIVKSGGKTRRAAKMDILNMSHPDIVDFIRSKQREEEKIHILRAAGIGPIEAQESVNYQNTNISVRAQDAFMEAVENSGKWKTIPVHSHEMAKEMPEYNAKELMRMVAEAAHQCGDPGIQFHDTINRWHTCPNTAPIQASNPCSEYMFLDNSSCNLASHNLMKYLNSDDTFRIQEFGDSIRTTAIAQDLFFHGSSSPTEAIAQNSFDYRPLGMGYANLGSMIMSLGFAYNSDEARNTAAAITAFMTGKVYETSTEMAQKVGPFKGFEKNREPMINVMEMHRKALDGIDRSKLPQGLEAVLDAAYETWDNVVERGKKYGFRNAQATVLAPTGTIGFMMDCDTKGVEPEIGLVQTKLLADGAGVLRLVNNHVEPVLERLGYNSGQINQIIEYIVGHKDVTKAPHLKPVHYDLLEEIRERKPKVESGFKQLEAAGYSRDQIRDIVMYFDGSETMEGAPHISKEHLPIFDCSNKPGWATRTIPYKAHIDMMAAVQPFLSGAISKTVNMPKETTVEEIEDAYMYAWKRGLKSIAIYRDQSKGVQVLSFRGEDGKLEKEVLKQTRKKLPTTAPSLRHKFDIGGHEGYIHVGLFEDGSPGEIFISMNKEGSTIGGLMDSFATSLSLNLQYGAPLEDLVKKFRHQRFEPRGLVYEGHNDIKTADSIVDYLAQFLEQQFLKGNGLTVSGENNGNSPNKDNLVDVDGEEDISKLPLGSQACTVCGAQMHMKDNCTEICKCGFVFQGGCGG